MITPEKINYQAAKETPALDIPPDLTTPASDTHFQVPNSSPDTGTTYSAYSAAHDKKSNTVATPAASGDCSGETVLPVPAHIKLERAGSERWLVVDEAPEQIWPLLKKFWQGNGFDISQSDPATGIMQTDWLENRVTVPQTATGSSGSQGSGSTVAVERDAYRTRLERSPNNPNQTEIYISHRGMTRTANASGKQAAIWQISPPDPGLEGEMLTRLMVQLGKNQVDANTQAQHNEPDRASLSQNSDSQPLLVDNELFDAAWPRVGVALDRTGFTVISSDRSKGIYTVQYTDPSKNPANAKKPGLLSKLAFWKHRDNNRKYQIELAENSAATSTNIRVLDSKGKPVAADTANQILKPLLDQLK
ncbi:MAG TPA: outer membrane protein assembly factor BamC [Burkholderiales bacterium]|nr:outer membrane protein assembly factor BamC [Burkholderiales bacterium]